MNYMSEPQAKFIRTLLLKLTGMKRSELANKYLIVKVEGQNDLIIRIKKDGTLDKLQVNKLQASGLINTIKEHMQNNPILNEGRTIEVR